MKMPETYESRQKIQSALSAGLGKTDLGYNANTITLSKQGDLQNKLRSVVRPQDVLLSSSFFDVLSQLTNSRTKKAVENIPTINNVSLFYSTDFYSSVKRQYFIGLAPKSFRKFYNIKLPFETNEQLWKSYRPSFRRNVRKSLKQGLHAEWKDGSTVTTSSKKELYEVHLDAAKRMCTFSLPWRLFRELFSITGVPVKVLYIKNDLGGLIGFQIMLGQIMYVSGVKTSALLQKTGNYLIHQTYKRHLHDILYIGTSFVGSGTDRFKSSSGAAQIPCHVMPEPLSFKLAHFCTNTGISKSKVLQNTCSLKLSTKKGLLSFLPYT